MPIRRSIAILATFACLTVITFNIKFVFEREAVVFQAFRSFKADPWTWMSRSSSTWTGDQNDITSDDIEEAHGCSKRPLEGHNTVPIQLQDISMEVLIKELSSEGWGRIHPGGRYKPNCTSPVKVAIIVPFRNRDIQLRIFLRHMHPFLQKQNLYYQIFVVEQNGTTPFNRASLFNVGFVQALKKDSFNCFIFHDVDLLPEDLRNYYGCPTSPRHMSVAVDKFNYQLPYAALFGGVGAFLKDEFELINGFSNLYWGWGGEDDDLYSRISTLGFGLTRPSILYARYTMVQANHYQSSEANPMRSQLLQTSTLRMLHDGLSSLRFDLLASLNMPLFTWIRVHICPQMYEADKLAPLI